MRLIVTRISLKTSSYSRSKRLVKRDDDDDDDDEDEEDEINKTILYVTNFSEQIYFIHELCNLIQISKHLY